MLKNSLIVLKEYSWIWDIVRAVKAGKRIDLDESHLLGGRKSGKSTHYFLLWIALCLYTNPKDFGWVSVRYYQESKKDLIKDFEATLDTYDLPYETNNIRSYIRLNGNENRFLGLNSVRSSKVKKAGFPRFNNVKYIFIFFEERYEFPEQDIQSVMEAIRSISISGVKPQIIQLNACNPWSKSNSYIQRITAIQKHNVSLLRTTGNQIGTYNVVIGENETKRVLIQYTNWRVAREFLSQTEINNIKDTWNIDKTRAATTDLGLPGYESGAIYTHLMNRISTSIYTEHEYVVGGGDYGWGTTAKAGKTVFLFGAASIFGNCKGIDIYGEYVQDNRIREKEPDLVAREVVEFYRVEMRKYLNMIGQQIPLPLRVRVDNSANILIRLLNKEAEARGLNKWLKFVPCYKYQIQDRIVITQALLANQMIRFNPSVKLLKEELELAQYKEDSKKMERENLNDHAINAFEYLMETLMWKFQKNENILVS